MMGRTEKVSINKCRIILKKYGHDYSDVEIEKIRDFLYILGEIEYAHYLKNNNENSNHIMKDNVLGAKNKGLTNMIISQSHVGWKMVEISNQFYEDIKTLNELIHYISIH